MKWLILIGGVLFAINGLLAADEVDAWIISYLEARELRPRQEFQWESVNAVGKDKVAARLREVVDGKRDRVGGMEGGGYGIGESTAERMLIGISDETAVAEAMEAYHRVNPWYSAVRDIVELGQELAIPSFASDLTSDEFLYFDNVRLPDGTTGRVKIPGKRRESAQYIVSIVINSAAFTSDVRASASRLKGIAFSEKEEFVSEVTRWWLQNQDSIESQRYGSVSRFAVPENGAVAVGAPQSARSETSAAGERKDAAENGPPIRSDASSTNAGHLWTYSLAGLLIVGLIVIVAVTRRDPA